MKQMLLLLSLMTISTASWAQSSYGVRAGMNLANVRYIWDGVKLSSTTKVGLNIGAFANFSLNEQISIQPELGFSQMGSKFDGGNETFNYVTLPLLTKYSLKNWGIYAGPQLAFLSSAKDKSDGQSESTKQYYNSTDFAAIIGADYSFTDKIFFNARYQLGLSNILEMQEMEQDDISEKMRNTGLTLSIGYKF